MDLYSVFVAIVLVLSGWILFRSTHAQNHNQVENSGTKTKSGKKLGINDEMRAKRIILEARDAIKMGDAKRAGQILQRVKAYPNTKAYQSAQSLKQDDNGLLCFASIMMFDAVFEEQLDSNYSVINDTPISLVDVLKESEHLAVENSETAFHSSNSGYESSLDSNSDSSYDSSSSSSFDSSSTSSSSSFDSGSF